MTRTGSHVACIVSALSVVTAALTASTAIAGTSPQGATFSYQGVLKQAGSPYTGSADFLFSLWEQSAAGPQVGGTQPIVGVPVTAGVFNVPLNFGMLAFDGNERWLQIEVRAPSGPGTYTTLSPRQRIDAVPYALYALNANTPFTFNGSNAVFTSGSVGIGTTSPAASLDVRNPSLLSGAAAVLGTMTGASTGFNSAGVHGANAGTSSGWGVWGTSNAGGSGAGVRGDATIGVWGAATGVSGWNAGVVGESLSPQGFAGYFNGRGIFSGDVAIGLPVATPNPAARLHVRNGGPAGVPFYFFPGFQTILAESNGSNYVELLAPDANESGVVFTRASAYPSNTNAGVIYNPSTVSDGLQFRTGGNVARMAITASGSVGIGTNNPQTGLHVEGPGYPAAFLSLASVGGNGDSGVRFGRDGTVQWHMFNSGVGGDALSIHQNGFGQVMSMLQNGDVGIGTASPGARLHVVSGNGAGNTLHAVNAASAGTGAASGVVGSTAQASASAAGVRGLGSHVSGTGVIGAGNNMVSTTLVFGSGGAFTGWNFGVFANSVQTGSSGAGVYAQQGANAVRVAYWDSVTFYKIQGTGTVSTIVRDADDKPVTMFAPEAPECLLQDFGDGVLVNGFAHIDLDPTFARNVLIDPTHPVRVFIQLEDNEFCEGVVVKNKSSTGFDVVELRGGRSNTPFTYQITARRADETLPDGRVSHYADLRFPPAAEPVTVQTAAADSLVARADDQSAVPR